MEQLIYTSETKFTDIPKFFDKLTIDKSVKNIPDLVFRNQIYLEEVTFESDEVYSIGYSSFENCPKLKEIKIPSKCTSIRDFAFSQCSSLEEVIIPDSVVELGIGAFRFCSYLEKVKLPENLRFIEDETFMGCYNLKEIEIPKNLFVIREWAFAECHSLEKMRLYCQEIENNAFDGDIKLGAVSFCPHVYHIGYQAFAGCPLHNIHFDDIDNVTFIDNEAFGSFTAINESTRLKITDRFGEDVFKEAKDETI